MGDTGETLCSLSPRCAAAARRPSPALGKAPANFTACSTFVGTAATSSVNLEAFLDSQRWAIWPTARAGKKAKDTT